jgi:hypothetical protein
MNKKPYDSLRCKEREEPPPHDYTTITFGWAFSDFDGCVYKEEVVMDPKKNIHLPWMDHRTGFFNPRLWVTVHNILIAK